MIKFARLSKPRFCSLLKARNILFLGCNLLLIMKNIILFALYLILTVACQEEKIKVPDIGRKIVINALITTDSLFSVSLTQSGPFADDYYQYPEHRFDAKIYQNNILVDSLYGFPHNDTDPNDFYLYKSDYGSKKITPLPGNEYKIMVNTAGLPEASATTKIPDLVRISFIDTVMSFVPPVTPLPLDQSFEGKITCNVQFSDPPGEKNYYILMLYKRAYHIRHPSIEELSVDCKDPIIEEKFEGGVAFSDKIINGKKHEVAIPFGCIAFGYPFYDDRDYTYGHGPTTIGPPIKKTFYFRLYSITEEFYKYIQTLNLYHKNIDNPLADPVLIYSNVNGGLGIFGGAAVSVDSLVYDYKKN